MNETPFFKTRMGQQFYEHTAPELVRQITRLADLLERLVAIKEREEANSNIGLP